MIHDHDYDHDPAQHRRETPGQYGESRITAIAWEGEDSAMVTLDHHGVSASIGLTREQLAQHRDAIVDVLAASEAGR